MDTSSNITCPSCGHKFNPGQAVTQQVEERLKAEFNQRFVQFKEAHLSKVEQEKADYLRKIEESNAKAQLEMRQKLAMELEAQLKASAEELEAKRKEVLELKKRELDMIQRERQLAEQKADMELDLQRKLLEESKKIEEHVKKKNEEEMGLRLREKDLKLEQLMQQIEIMKKKAEQGSMQVQGEVQEMALKEILEELFPVDEINDVGKGVRGADVVQVVCDRAGNACGTIIYESKRTQHFSNEWIEKLKVDLRSQKADLAILVTQALPPNVDRFAQKDGIWICTFQDVKAIVSAIRDGLLRTAQVRSSQINKGEKMQLLYDYLSGNEFRQSIEALVEAFTSLQEGVNKERQQMEKLWKEREKQIEKALLSTSGMYGSIKGIAGNAIATVHRLELGS